MLCDWEGEASTCAWLVINSACQVIKYLPLSPGRGAGGWSASRAWWTSCQLIKGPI